MKNKYYIIQTKDHDLNILDKFNNEVLKGEKPLVPNMIYTRETMSELYMATRKFGKKSTSDDNYWSLAEEQIIWFRQVTFGKGFDIDTFMSSITNIPNKPDVLKALAHVAEPTRNKAWRVTANDDTEVGWDIVWADTANEAKDASDLMGDYDVPYVDIRVTRMPSFDNREFELTGTKFNYQPLVIETLNMDWFWEQTEWIAQDGQKYNAKNHFYGANISQSSIIEDLAEYDNKPVVYRPVTVEDLDRYFKLLA